MPAFLVAEAEAEADEEVAETGAVLVDEATDVPVDEPVAELAGATADETADVAVAVVLLDKQLTASGTVTPAVMQIFWAYKTAAA
jgi:hypothetical protein